MSGMSSSPAPLELNSTTNGSGLATPVYPAASSLDEESFVGEPVYSRNIRFVLYAVVFVFAIIGNGLVCYITFRNRRMWTFSYALITNLAVSEIGTVLCLPYFLVMDAKGSWIFGEVMCQLVSPSVFMFNIATTNTMVAIACDRYRAVVYPFKFRPSTSETRLIITIIWLVSFLCALPSFGALKVVSFPDVPDLYMCTEVFSPDEEANLLYIKIYSMALFVLNCMIPIVFIVLLYLKIAVTLKKPSLLPNLQSQRPSSLRLTPNNSPRNSVHMLTMSDASAKARNETERKFLRMLLVVVLVFFSCYVPYQILYLVYEFLPELAYQEYLHTLAPYIYLVTWFPNAINPICYGSLNAYYARAFKGLLCGTRKYAAIVIRKTSNAGANLRINISPPMN